MTRRRYPLLRAIAELVNAANGVQPLGCEGYITLPVFVVRLADHRTVAALHGRFDA